MRFYHLGVPSAGPPTTATSIASRSSSETGIGGSTNRRLLSAIHPELHHNLPCLVSMGPAYEVFLKPTSGLYRKKALHAESAWEAERIAA
jgi:hypothetical protein